MDKKGWMKKQQKVNKEGQRKKRQQNGEKGRKMDKRLKEGWRDGRNFRILSMRTICAMTAGLTGSVPFGL